ncbi:MAG: carbohydrate ABC transporter permease [Clostridiaceae bacterium]|nr:carbohydrate ABC transporter permease [Clostridiaceae bacterium]
MKKRHKHIRSIIRYVFMVSLGIVLLFPLVIMFFSSFKSNKEVFGTLEIIPREFRVDGYINGWKGMGSGRITFGKYLYNTIFLVIPIVFGTIISSLTVAYGFSRFEFPFKKILFAVMMSFLMLPAAVLIVPRYLVFAGLGWIDSYLPFWVPSFFATSSFFIYMFIQFFRGIPYDLDEAAYIDGCSSFGVLTRILTPLCVPAIISASIFQFIWGWNDFFNQNIYISSPAKYTVSLALKMAMDASTGINWPTVLAMSVVSLIPSTVVFLTLQKYFVEGMATSGLKG